MLVIKNLSLYLSKDLRNILEDFSFSLNKGQKVALIGEEGNGKSTLLKAIADPDSINSYMEIKGEIFKDGEKIGYLPQSLDENILSKTTSEYLNSKVDIDQFDYNLYYDLIGQTDFPEERISESILLKHLSGGEKIKFQLICEMMQSPTILLLDEPSNDMDLKSVKWLEGFINSIHIPIMFVSHDEVLLENCANTIIHFEQLIKKSKPQYTIATLSYSEYVENRTDSIVKQTQLAKKEQAEYDAKMERYRKVYERVQHELRSVSRQAPTVGKNLKDKMHSVKSMGKRFEKEKENLTKTPDSEDSILVRFGGDITIPNGKLILDFHLDELKIGNLILSKDIHLSIYGSKKLCIVGNNGSGKTTLLKKIRDSLKDNSISVGYMPQDYSEMMNPEETAIDFLSKDSSKEENTKVRTYLGSVNFTKEEMFHPVSSLSGGQRAKLYFSKMILEMCEVLILDEPTRNLSPLSGPEVRQALKNFNGCIIAVSHDRRFIEEVFDEVVELDKDGLNPLNI